MKNSFKLLLLLSILSTGAQADTTETKNLTPPLDDTQTTAAAPTSEVSTSGSATETQVLTPAESTVPAATLTSAGQGAATALVPEAINSLPQPAPQNTSKVLGAVVLVDDEKTKATAELIETTYANSTSEVIAPRYDIEIESLDKVAAAQHEKNMADPKLVAASRGWCGGPGPVGWDGQSGQYFSIQARDNDRAVAGTTLGGHYGTCPRFVTYVFNKTSNTLTSAADGAVIDNPQAVQAFAHFWDALPSFGNVEELLQAEAAKQAEVQKFSPPLLQAQKKAEARQGRHAALLAHAKAARIKHHRARKHAAQYDAKPAKKHHAKKLGKAKHHRKAKQLQKMTLKGGNGAGIYHHPAVTTTVKAAPRRDYATGGQILPTLQPRTATTAPQPAVTQDASTATGS